MGLGLMTKWWEDLYILTVMLWPACDVSRSHEGWVGMNVSHVGVRFVHILSALIG